MCPMLAGYANFLIAGGTAGQSRSFSCYDVVEIGLPGLPDSPLGHAPNQIVFTLAAFRSYMKNYEDSHLVS